LPYLRSPQSTLKGKEKKITGLIAGEKGGRKTKKTTARAWKRKATSSSRGRAALFPCGGEKKGGTIPSELLPKFQNLKDMVSTQRGRQIGTRKGASLCITRKKGGEEGGNERRRGEMLFPTEEKCPY